MQASIAACSAISPAHNLIKRKPASCDSTGFMSQNQQRIRLSWGWPSVPDTKTGPQQRARSTINSEGVIRNRWIQKRARNSEPVQPSTV